MLEKKIKLNEESLTSQMQFVINFFKFLIIVIINEKIVP